MSIASALKTVFQKEKGVSATSVLKNKTALITGASAGIGMACAERLAQEGCHLVLAARRTTELNQLADQLTARYPIQVHVLSLDVSDKKAVATELATLPEAFQGIDILINNAGLALGLETLQNGDPEDWDTIIDVNVKGLLYVSRALLPAMISRNTGHIVNLGSIAGHVVYPYGNVYCATKHAVAALTQALRMDLFGTALRVTSIDPGMVETDFSMVRFKGDKERAKAVYQGFKPLSPNDIADAVVYALSCPPHVNISQILIMPTAQAAATMIARQSMDN